MDEMEQLEKAIVGWRRQYDEVAAERDRLRAVVGAVQGYISSDLEDEGEDVLEVFRDLRRIMRSALDGSEATDG